MRKSIKPVRPNPEQQLLLDQVQQIALGLSQTFAPFCEVVVHELLDPAHSIVAIHNNLSGRAVGDPSTELGLARIADPDYPQVIAAYANQFADGRQAKSTSIGIRDSSGAYVAALCLNIDLTLFSGLQNMIARFSIVDATTGAEAGAGLRESLDPNGAEAIRRRIDEMAAGLSAAPRALKAEQRRALLATLKKEGLMEVKRAMEVVALHLGVSRATVYNDAK